MNFWKEEICLTLPNSVPVLVDDSRGARGSQAPVLSHTWPTGRMKANFLLSAYCVAGGARQALPALTDIKGENMAKETPPWQPNEVAVIILPM